MTLGSFSLILRRQFRHKWGRFLLASGGIMIGIWAITLTSSLSLGLRDTFIQAVNSQSQSTLFTMSRPEDGKSAFSFSANSTNTKLKAISVQEIQDIKKKHPQIEELQPTGSLIVYLKSNNAPANFDCSQSNPKDPRSTNNSQAPDLPPIAPTGSDNYEKYCQSKHYSSSVFSSFYQNNKKNWHGQTSEPKENEIAACFKCGDYKLNEKIGAKTPEEMLGKKINLEFFQVPNVAEAGTYRDSQYSYGIKDLPSSITKEMKIVSVVDDGGTNNNPFAFGAFTFFINSNLINNLTKQAKWDFNVDKIGYFGLNGKLKSFDNYDEVSNSLKDDKYEVFSDYKFLVDGINSGFQVVTGVLSTIGAVALIASIFGIINVITISVLERRKEIGILKSLGAKNGDIFGIFLLESMSLGFLGWLMGTGLAALVGFGIGQVARIIIGSDESLRKNLESLDINSFAPTFPWWLLLGTLGISLFFTILAGIIPSIQASKQNPVDVLRAE